MTAPARLHSCFSAAILVFALGLSACQSKSSEDLPEWSPADHTNQGTPNAGQVDTTKRREGMAELEARGISDVVLAAWRTNCVTCHGPAGRGDGPQGRMAQPPDMADPAWQRTRIESEMKHTIQKGRGRMPAFPQLPEKTVDGLVQLVRMLNREATSAAPGAAAKPSAPSEKAAQNP